MANPIFPSQSPGILQPTVHPIHNAQNRILDPATQKWIPLKQPLTDLNADFALLNVMKGIFTELRVMNYLLAATLGYNDSLDELRADPSFDFDLTT